ncbi:MAG TPA: HemK/PrmC family methyltransferase [Acidimicrobiales bacterium]|nr:HemK/PrmC family methyltransferase [Acidimicrobiales bacterium]
MTDRATWRVWYGSAASQLRSAIEARRIVEEAASDPWPRLLDEPVSRRAAAYFEQMVARRAGGEPLQYVLGRWGFRGLDLMVDRRVLIPRPETEQVVSVALTELERLVAAGVSDPVMVDLGTGSGAIALSLAAEGRRGSVWGTDSSDEALAVARANLAGLSGFAAARVRLVSGSWWSALPAEVRDWEPAVALHGGPTGLDAISVVVSEAPAWLARPGTLVVEVAPPQADTVTGLARSAGFESIRVEPDLAGRARVQVARL